MKRTFLFVAVFVASCAPGVSRTYVIDTDNLARSGSYAFEIPQLLVMPVEPTREIATIAGYVVATRDDEVLWQDLSVRAARLGANAIFLLKREIVPCTEAASGYGYATLIGNAVVAAAASSGERAVQCTHITVKALLSAKAINCRETQICRQHRRDAETITSAAKLTP